MQNTFTVQEIRNYLLKQDGMEDIAYTLSEEDIVAANSDEDRELTEDEIPFLTHHMQDENDLKNIQDFI